MKLLSSLLLSLLCCFTAAAQDHLTSLDKVSLDLSRHSLRVEEIIDQRPAKSSIGWVQKGMVNQKQPVNFKNGFTTELMRFINSHGAGPAAQLPLVLKIQKLTVWEETLFSKEYAHAELALTFYAKKDEHYLYLASASAVTKSSGMDVTGKHDDNLVRVWQQCFDQLARENLQERLQAATPLSLADLMQESNAATPQEFAILTTAPKAGVYGSFQEFRDNSPGNTIPITIKEKGRLDYVAHFVPDNQKVTNAWGFSDGNTFYIHYSNSFFPLVQHEEGFVFYGYGAINSQHVATAAVLGGAIGGAIAGATSGKGQTVEYSLNMLTGTVQSPENEQFLPTTDETTPATITLYRRGKGQLQEQVFLSINDTLTLELAPNALRQLVITPPVGELKFYTRDKKEPVFVFTPTVGLNRFIEISLPEKRGASLSVKVVEEKIGEFYTKEIELIHEKQNRQR
ncbi:hypothetical protein [Cesiribacter andamanensis]|uniref:Uncharacterized protein n=1 Tax=Cesiribacter andamanensis AMV16 TaxID=1279009 RepID=M7NRK7_9BACT|nr:hypothetical protein [Cesiribacter andamanensis]EMR04315.1 hypothetical protein ADICEAN_00478 [Cesiribacter andamanensis AMV16]